MFILFEFTNLAACAGSSSPLSHRSSKNSSNSGGGDGVPLEIDLALIDDQLGFEPTICSIDFALMGLCPLCHVTITFCSAAEVGEINLARLLKTLAMWSRH